MGFKVELQYFKKSGKFYSEGDYVSEKEDMYHIFDEVRGMLEDGRLPGLADGCREFHIYINAVDHPNRYPGMVFTGWDR